MSVAARYMVFVSLICAVAVIVGVLLLRLAYRSQGKAKEIRLASGNILIAVFAAIGSAFAADFFRPSEGSHEAPMMAVATLTSSDDCLNRWYIGEVWHYSLTSAKSDPVWQVARPTFSRLDKSRITGQGVWLDPVNSNERIPYSLEVGCRGKRGVLILTQVGVVDSIPTIEIYPELPESAQLQLIGYAVDQTWDEREVVAPVMISKTPLHGSDSLGVIVNRGINQQLATGWRERYDRHTGKAHDCTLCPILTAGGLAKPKG